MTYSLYQTFTDLVVTKEDYSEAEIFTQQYLTAMYPTLDLREGSPLRDIVIRPCATMVALVNKGVTKYFNDNSLSGATDSTPTSTVDAIMSNFFLTRNQGSTTQITAQVRFSTAIPATSVSVPVSTTFSVDNVNKFSPLEATTLSLTDGSLQLYSDNTGNQYYFGNVVLEAHDAGSASNVEVGQEFLYFTIFDPYFLGASVRSIATSGVDAETNTQFINRAGNSISTRNLINSPSIETQLNATFPAIKSILVSGYGDYEQFRDYRLLSLSSSNTPVPVHLGGFVDAYCATKLSEKIIRIKFGADGTKLLGFSEPIVSFSAVASGEKASFYDDGSPVETQDPTVNVTDINNVLIQDLQYTAPTGVVYESQTGFSSKQRVKVSSAGTPYANNATIDLKILYWEGLSSVQSYLEDPQYRVISGDYLARGFNVIELLPTIEIVDGAPTGDALVTLKTDIVNALSDYIATLNPGQSFVFSEALSYLTSKVTSYQFSSNISFISKLYPGQVGVTNYAVSPSTKVIDATYISNNTAFHDESGTMRVARTFVFTVRTQGVTLI